jgi:pimeloyl-ACP methyl ester carboxylesterase
VIIHSLNIDINIQTFGSGARVVWGHGLMGSMATDDRTQSINWELIGQVARVARYDARGHGQSQASPDPADYTWANLGKDMLAIAAQLGFDKFVAGGESMGSASALFAAMAAPQRVRALVLANPPTAWETRAGQTSIYTQMAELAETRGMDALMRMMALRPPTPAWLFEAYPQTAEIFQDALAARDPHTLAVTLRGAGLCDLPPREALRDLRMPTLILAWSDDPGHPLSTAEELAGLLPASRLVVARSASEWETWSRQVRDFIAGLPPT